MQSGARKQTPCMNLEQQGTRIHILRGTGRNCTCGDCPVLYGGECWTTPENDFLDALGARVAKATVNGRVVSKNDMHKALEAIRSPVKKYLHISEEIYNRELLRSSAITLHHQQRIDRRPEASIRPPRCPVILATCSHVRPSRVLVEDCSEGRVILRSMYTLRRFIQTWGQPIVTGEL